MKDILFLFLKLGAFAFGGPAAHIALMQHEVVAKKKWISDEHFLDLVGATSLIPGPNSTEMAMHCGMERRGFAGLLLAGTAFILPAALITLAFAWMYVQYGALPQVAPFFIGLRPAVLALILSAVYTLGKKALKSWQLGIIGAMVFALNLGGVSEIVALLIGGIVGVVWFQMRGQKLLSFFSLGALPVLSSSAESLPVLAQLPPSLWQLSLFFLKIGSVLFGSGYVLIAYLEGEMVQRFHWLTQTQLLDAVAIGQFTPGPVLTTATFIGFQLQGFWGAILSTICIFLPSFFFVLALNPFIPKLRKSKLASRFLDAVNISAISLMLVACVGIVKTSLWGNPVQMLIAAVATFLLLGWKKLHPIWIIVFSSLGGAFWHFFFAA